MIVKLGGLLFSYGMKTGYGVLVWWVLTAITLLSAIPTLFMVDHGQVGQDVTKLDTEEVVIEEEADTHDGYGTVKRVTSHHSSVSHNDRH